MKATVNLNQGSTTEKLVEVTLPPGYYRVWVGAVKPRDYYLDMTAILKGKVYWREILISELKPVGSADLIYQTAEWYGCLIRKGVPVGQDCDQCKHRGAAEGDKYCDVCLTKLKRRGR